MDGQTDTAQRSVISYLARPAGLGGVLTDRCPRLLVVVHHGLAVTAAWLYPYLHIWVGIKEHTFPDMSRL